MNHNIHISHDEIFPLGSKNRPIQSHLKGCDQCSELVNVLRHASKLSKNLKSDKDRSHPSTMKLSETLTQIYDSSISPQEAANFFNHVESCSQCFNYVAMTVEESLSPVPEQVLEEIKVYSDISLAEKALGLAGPPPPGLLERLWAQIKKSAEKIKEAVLPPFSQAQPGSVWAIRTGIPITLVAAIALAIFLLPTEPSAFVYDDVPPFPYSRSSFRGTSVPIGQDPNYIKFHNGFSSAAADYMNLDYDNYVRRMANLESIVLDLKTKPLKKAQLDEIRDFYFYYGAAHFALSRSESRDLSSEQKTEHSEKATQYLLEAKSLAMESNLDMVDRDIYFLGLAYGFGGQRENAVSQLQQIERGNHRFEEAVKLIKDWSEE